MTTVKEINAHRLILALVSDVFKKGFYGGIADDGSIEIKDASKESFEAMINYIYNKKNRLILYDLDILCSLYYLGDKYNINTLVTESLEAIRWKPITTENVLDVGLLGDQYSVYEELAETLYDKAARSLSYLFNGEVTKVGEYFTKLATEAPASTSCKSLVRILARVGKPPVCDSCKAFPCMSGVEVTKDNFVPGANIQFFLSEDEPLRVYGDEMVEGKLVKLDPTDNNRFQLQLGRQSDTDNGMLYQMAFSEEPIYGC